MCSKPQNTTKDHSSDEYRPQSTPKSALALSSACIPWMWVTAYLYSLPSDRPLSSIFLSYITLLHNFLFSIKTLYLSYIKTRDYILSLPGWWTIICHHKLSSHIGKASFVVVVVSRNIQRTRNLYIDTLELTSQPNMPYCIHPCRNNFKYGDIERLKVKVCKNSYVMQTQWVEEYQLSYNS